MINNKLKFEETSFKKECKILYFRFEYRGYSGDLKCAIATKLSIDELNARFPNIIQKYEPFILITLEQWDAVEESHCNDDKFEKRIKRSYSLFDINDGQFEIHHPECSFEIDHLEEIEKKDNIEKLYIYIDYLDNMQRRRLIRNRINGESIANIARDEGVSETAVKKSIDRAIENLKKYCGQ